MNRLITLAEYLKEYKMLYDAADALFKEYSPCEPHPDGTCICTRERPGYTPNPADRCCYDCTYHSREQGCLTISLQCKMWLCGFLYDRAYSEKYPRLNEFVSKLKSLQRRFRELPVSPGCREALADTINRFNIHKYQVERWGGKHGHSTQDAASTGYTAASQLGR